MRAAARSVKLANFLSNRAIWLQSRRTYLSAEYSCEKEWKSAVEADPLLQNIVSEIKFVDVMRKFGTKTDENIALGVDIFVNSIDNKSSIEEMGSILNRLRRSKHTAWTLPSTSPAAVRYCLQNGYEEKLIEFFENRLEYGIFPDTQTLNYMLDHCLTRKMYTLAAKVAVHFMLQEDRGNEISRILSLIACERYLSAGKERTPWKDEPIVEENDDEDDEVEYVRVPNLTNPFFDDHFDLTDPNELVGKTLIFLGKASEGIVRDSAILIGLARRQKWDELKGVLSKVGEISKDTKKLCMERIETSPQKSSEETKDEAAEDAEKDETATDEAEVKESPIPDWLEAELSKVKTNGSTLFELLEKDAKNLKDIEKTDREIQKNAFKEYVDLRAKKLAEQNWTIERRERFEILKAKKRELVEKEELYYAFENWNKLEMLHKQVLEEKGEIKKKEEEYVPPDIKTSFKDRAAAKIL